MSRVPLVLVICLLLAPVSSASATTPTTVHANHDEADTIFVEYTLSPGDDPSTLNVQVSATLPSHLTQFRFDVSAPPEDFEVIDRDGFARDGDYMEWNEYTTTPTFTYQVATNQSGSMGLESTYGDSWTFVTSSHLTFTFRYRYRGSEPAWQNSLAIDSDGYAGPAVAVLGNVSTSESQSANVRLIVPEAASESPNESAIFTTLNQSRTVLDVGAEPSQLNVFVAPNPIRGGGLAPHTSLHGETDVWVNEDMPTSSRNNVWTHEYVHARQQFTLDSDMEWFVEGSAEYYDTLIPLYRGHISFEMFQHTMTDDSASGTLSRGDTWASDTPYTQGGQFLAALDAHIHADTNGTASLVDVFAQMNQHDEAISLDEFRTMVVAETGNESLSSWITKYATTEAVPPVSNDPSRYAQTRRVDSDGDGLFDRDEVTEGTHPFEADTDGDGVKDGAEVMTYGTAPTVRLTDGDAFPDGVEIEVGTAPTRWTPTHEFVWQMLVSGSYSVLGA